MSTEKYELSCRKFLGLGGVAAATAAVSLAAYTPSASDGGDGGAANNGATSVEDRADLDLLKTWIYNSGPTMDWAMDLTNDVEGVGPVMGGGSVDFSQIDFWTAAYPTVHMWIGQM
jgi:hypothetical protein